MVVLGQFYWGTVPDKLIGCRCFIKVNVIDSVSSFVTPIGDDRSLTELQTYSLLPLVLAVALFSDLLYFLKASLR